MIALSENLFLYPNTCNVYVLRQNKRAVLIDFGDGSILDGLREMGIREVAAILMTHHHRDQAQGLQRAVQAGIPIWVPEVERELFSDANWHWQARNILNNYNVRQDRFSLLQSVPVAGMLRDYEQLDFAGIVFDVIPTPGHTPGSISLAAEIDGKKYCFVGDLIAGPGKVWSLAATQWTYNGAEGAAYSVLSLLDVQKRAMQCLLPSHGEVMNDPEPAIDLLVERLMALLNDRGEHRALLTRTREPLKQITAHVYRNLTSVANSYVVISETGKALIIDFGYDFIGGLAAGTDRASRRPWLYTLPVLKERYGVKKIDAVLPTHYHDDHVAGMNLLKRVEGAALWAPENFSDILNNPMSYDLPCLWYDPIPVDVVLPLEKKIQWEEFAITLHALPGHTRYAVAILLEVDGKRILFTGDQYQGEEGLIWNYVYQNRYALTDYLETAHLYEKLQPDIILPGHWSGLSVETGYYREIIERAEKLAAYHRDILPLEVMDLGMEGFIGRLMPYQSSAGAGDWMTYECEITNPMDTPQRVKAVLIVPDGWQVEPSRYEGQIECGKTDFVEFRVRVPEGHAPERRIRIAVDISVGEHLFGQQAEALINITG